LKRGWTDFSRRASRVTSSARGIAVALPLVWAAALAAATPAAPAQHGAPAREKRRAAPRVHELTLAKLRPGVSTRAGAERLFRRPKAPAPSAAQQSAGDAEWLDGCTGRWLLLDLHDDGRIRSITVSALGARWPDCPANPPDWLQTRSWRTGRGLSLGAARARVEQLYGPPQSSGPSTQQGRTLELMFYSFDWAGDDVPQVMEITLERGRVVQITLAASSL